MKEAQLIRYTRKSNGQLNGCLVAAKIDGVIHVGFSKCRKTDVFKKAFAKALATRRMQKYSQTDIQSRIPITMANDLERFEARLQRYYKN